MVRWIETMEIKLVGGKPAHRGFVVITGTSTGIGAATALHLAGKGFHVLAGVRRKADGEAMRAKASGTLTPLVIDVTNEKTISTAAAAVADAVGERGLAGLVNNAGIAKPAPIRHFDRSIRNGLGVMFDDLLAAFYTLLCLAGWKFFIG